MEKVSYLEYEVEKDEVQELEIADEAAREEISSMKTKLDGLQEDVENCDICGIATGSTVNITDSAEAPFEALTLYGESKQLQPTGKNLFGFEKSAIDVTEELRKLDNQRLIFTKINDNSIKCNYSWGTYATGFVELNGVDGTKNYAFSFDVKNNTLGFTPRIEKYTQECTSEKLVLSIYSGSGGTEVSGNEYFILENIQVEEGTTATSYEPYTGGKAAPNPDYPQMIEPSSVGSVSVRGKNLLNANGLSEQTISGVTFTPVYENGLLKYVNVNGTNDGTGDSNYELSTFLGSGTFLLNGASSNVGRTTYRLATRIDGVWDGTKYQDTTKDVQITIKNSLTVVINVLKGATITNEKIYPMLRPSFFTDGTYEPYESQMASLSAPIELNGIGDVKDSSKLKKFNEIVFNGSENWTQYNSQTYPHLFMTNVSVPANGLNKPVLCSHFPYSNGDLLKGLDECRFKNDAKAVVFYLSSSKHTDVSAFKSWLASNPITLVYELATPIETALPQADIDAIKALHTYKPNTVVMNDADAEMEIQYFKNTENGAVTGSLREDVNNLNKKSAEALVHDDVVDDLSSEDADLPLSANQGRALNEKIDSIFSFIDEDSLMLDSNEFSGLIVDKELGTFTADKEGIYHFYGSMRIYGTSSEYQSGQIYLEIEYDSPSLYRIIKTGCKLCEGNAGSDYPNELELIPLDTTLYLKEDEKVLFTLKTQTPYEDDLYIEDDVHVFCRYKSAE